MKENSLLAIIAAAGIGKRFDGDLPKQYVKINGRSIIENAVKPVSYTHLRAHET